MTVTTTSDQVFYKTYGANAAENYERYFVPVIGGPLAADLVAEAALQPGERVLDVACGTGVIARLAAERVGPSGTVAALDINAGMLAVARSITPATAASVRWYETSAESIPLPDAAFDVVLCQLGLQFIGDKSAALREMRRVLVPGGRVLVSVPRPTPFFDVLDQAMLRHVGETAANFVRCVFSLNDPAHLQQLFRAAGFRDLAARTDTRTIRLPAAKDFLWEYVHSTPLTGLLPQSDPRKLAAIEHDVVSGWQPWAREGGMSYQQSLIVVTGRK